MASDDQTRPRTPEPQATGARVALVDRLRGLMRRSSNGHTPQAPAAAAAAAAPVAEMADLVRMLDGRKGVQLLNVTGNDILQAGGSPMGPMGGYGNDVARVNRYTAFAAAAYCYVAIRYHMRKFSEPPLMVVAEDQESGAETWIPDHALSELLLDPNLDLDMGGMLRRTRAYLDVTGQCLWVKDLTRGGMVGSLMPFHGDEFTVDSANGRMYGKFKLTSDKVAAQDRTKMPEEVVFFQEENPFDWHKGTSKVDIALSWLNLSAQALASTRDVLRNALFPSVIVQADAEWNPTDPEWEKFKQALAQYADREHRGGPLALLGGGSATKVGLTLRDLVPADILERVESVVAAVWGIPAIVLQYQIGMENSPWSQMREARRMAYEETIEPEWRDFENTLSRQLLWAPVAPGRRELDSDHTHFIRFDTSKIRALQVDLIQMSQVASIQGKMASLNERRRLVSLDPSTDPRADEIPELRDLDRVPAPVAPAGFENPFAAPEALPAEEDEAAAAAAVAQGEEEDEEEAATAASAPGRRERKAQLSRKARVWHTYDNETKQATDHWEMAIAGELTVEQKAIIAIVESFGPKAARRQGIEHKASPKVSKRMAAQMQAAVEAWLKGRGSDRLRAVAYPLVTATSTSAVTAVAADLGLTFGLLQPGLLDYAIEETLFLSNVMGQTTGASVAATVQKALEDGDTIRKLVKRLEVLPDFDRNRAKVVARTETTRAWNGAQRRQVESFSKRTRMVATKTWLTAGDDRVRAEHEDMENETVKIDEEFSNGLMEPGEPNCFPGFVEVQGSYVAGLRANYAGKIIELRTTGGRHLTVTPNHPILTAEGWVQAHLLNQDSQILCYSADGRSGADLNEHGGPLPIAQVFETLGQRLPRLSRKVGPEDLHGDALWTDREIEIIGPIGQLLDDIDAQPLEHSEERILVPTPTEDSALSGAGSSNLGSVGVGLTTPGLPGSSQLPLDEVATATCRDTRPLHSLRIGPAADLDVPRFEATGEERPVVSGIVADLLERFPGEVSLDQIVEVQYLDFTGHVYDLQSMTGLNVAGGIITSNCRCTLLYALRAEGE